MTDTGGQEIRPAFAGEFDVQLARFVEQITDYAIVALDPQGLIQTWNLGAQRLKGYTAEEVMGHSFAMFYTAEDRRAGLPTRLLLEALDKGRVEHTGWRLRKDGSRFWGDVVITAAHDPEGLHTGFIKVTRDRSELKLREESQDAFYAAFSHDFKTPVTAMLGYIDALRYAPETARERLIDRAEANARRLFEMVDELIAVARERAESSSIRIDEVDLAAVARRALNDLPLHLGADRVRFPIDAVALARANGAAMKRVITNLVVNALKYSPPDSVVRLAVTESDAGEVEITVADHGRGIHPDDLDVVFEEFQRGRLATDDGGTGLGLASVRSLLDQQDGTICLDSEVGVGTTVTVTLPGALTAPGTSRTAGQKSR